MMLPAKAEIAESSHDQKGNGTQKNDSHPLENSKPGISCYSYIMINYRPVQQVVDNPAKGHDPEQAQEDLSNFTHTHRPTH
jgi:hypothetical protein